MRIFGIKILTAAIVFSAMCGAYADLVWTKEKGWEIEGGVLAKVVGESTNVENALQAMNEAKAAYDDGSLRKATEYYLIVAEKYPNSVFAPEAYYQLGIIYMERNMFGDSFKCLDHIIKNFPDFGKFNLVVGQKYKLAQKMQAGARPYLWGWMPWVRNDNTTISYYESVVSDAPFSDYAPMALMNIAILADKTGKSELSIDALDRLINTYPQSIFAPDAYLQMAKTYRNMVQGSPYDQASVVRAMDFYQDFLILFPKDAAAANAEEGLDIMKDTHARSRLIMGDFYYQYRNNPKAASIFYNETITLAPNSLAAQEAREHLKDIAEGTLAPMTPADWFLGRYKAPEYDIDQAAENTALQSDQFEVRKPQDFQGTSLEAPKTEAAPESDTDAAASVQPAPETSEPEKQGDTFAPLHGKELDDMLNKQEGTLEDKSND